MKKPLLIIMTVAILGGLGLYVNKGGGSASTNLMPSTTNSGQASTLSSNTSSNSSDSGSSSTSTATYKDGTYTGSTTQTPYGPVQVAVIVSGGKISDVQFLEMPSDQGHSREVTSFSEPLLKQEAIQKQTANIDFVSGATSTSEGFEQSLQNALNQAA